MENRPIQRIDLILLGLTLALATLLRVIGLDSPLWYDEIITLTDSVRPPLIEILSNPDFNNHPFYSLQAKLAITLFGESPAALRLPALLFGVASIAATWLLMNRLTDALRAHVIALLLALAYHHIWYSQNARAYTELMFWFTISTIVLVDAMRRPTMRRWVFYGVLAAIGLYTHLTAAPYLLAHAILAGGVILFPHALRASQSSADGTVSNDIDRGPHRAIPSAALSWRMLFVAFAVGTCLAGMLYSATFAGILDNANQVVTRSETVAIPEYQSPIWTALEILRSFAMSSQLNPLAFGVAACAVFLVGVGMRDLFRREPILPLVLVLHVPLILAILLAMSTRIWPRFFFVDMGLVLLFLTQGVYVVADWIATRARAAGLTWFSSRAFFVASAAAMCLISMPLALRNYSAPKQDFAGAHAYVAASRGPDDSIVLLDLAAVPFEKYLPTDWPAIEEASELESIEARDDRTWLVMAFPARAHRRFPEISRALEARYEVSRVFPGTLGDGNVLVYVSRAAPVAPLSPARPANP